MNYKSVCRSSPLVILHLSLWYNELRFKSNEQDISGVTLLEESRTLLGHNFLNPPSFMSELYSRLKRRQARAWGDALNGTVAIYHTWKVKLERIVGCFLPLRGTTEGRFLDPFSAAASRKALQSRVAGGESKDSQPCRNNGAAVGTDRQTDRQIISQAPFIPASFCSPSRGDIKMMRIFRSIKLFEDICLSLSTDVCSNPLIKRPPPSDFQPPKI